MEMGKVAYIQEYVYGLIKALMRYLEGHLVLAYNIVHGCENVEVEFFLS